MNTKFHRENPKERKIEVRHTAISGSHLLDPARKTLVCLLSRQIVVIAIVQKRICRLI